MPAVVPRPFLFLLFLLVLSTPSSPTPVQAQALNYTTSWLGNTQPPQEGVSVQDHFNSLWVSPDGTCYTNSGWDEQHYASGVYRQGRLVGRMDFLDVSGGKGGIGISGDAEFVYFGYYDVLRRYKHDGTSGYWAGRDGKPTWGIHVVPPGHGWIRGLAADTARHRLFVAIGPDGDGGGSDDVVQVYDTSDLNAPPVLVPVPQPREVAASGDGTFWVVTSARTPRRPTTWTDRTLTDRILHFRSDGTRLPQEITGPEGFFPTALCFDQKHRLLVADDGPDQDVKIYGPAALTSAHPLPGGSLGVRGGVHAGIGRAVGRLAPAAGPPRFHGLCGLGVDGAGNVYVAQSAFGPDWNFQQGGGLLECVAPDGRRRWQAQGLEFVDSAAADPGSETGGHLDVYTKYFHYVLDLSQTKPGLEAVPVGFTVDPFRHPYDARFVNNGTFSWSHVSQCVVVEGHRLVLMGGMDNDRVRVYRSDPAHEGETLIECVTLYAGSIARDANANGRYDDPGEVTSAFLPGGGDVCKTWSVDSHGGLWESYDGGGRTGIRHYLFGGFDTHGAPVWAAAAGRYEDVAAPAPFSEVRRVIYDAAEDVLYLSGYSSNADPARNLVPGQGYGTTDNKSAGSVVARYDHWSQGNRTAAWARVVFVPTSTNPASEILGLAVAGEYVFTGHSGFGRPVGGPVLIYRAKDGLPVGEINSEAGGANAGSGLDVPYPLNAYRWRNGEYLIFEESDGKGRVVMMRWRP